MTAYIDPADGWRNECIRLWAYANAAHWWAEAHDDELHAIGEDREKARQRMLDAEADLLRAGYVFSAPNAQVTGADRRPG